MMACWLTLYNNSFGLFSVKTMIKNLVLGLFLFIEATLEFQFRHSSWDQWKSEIHKRSSSIIQKLQKTNCYKFELGKKMT